VLHVAEWEASRVHRFSLKTREVEGTFDYLSLCHNADQSASMPEYPHQ